MNTKRQLNIKADYFKPGKLKKIWRRFYSIDPVGGTVELKIKTKGPFPQKVIKYSNYATFILCENSNNN